MEGKQENFGLVVKATPGTIEDNLTELQGFLERVVKPMLDTGKEVNSDTLKEATAALAKLRKLQGVLESKRKIVKKDLSEPYDRFKEKYDTATEVLTSYIKNLADDVAKTKELERVRKLEKIEEIIKEKLSEKPDSLAAAINEVPKLRNPKWENGSYTFTKIEKEIEENVAKISNELMALSEVPDEFFNQAKTEYMEAGLANALFLVDRLKQEKEKDLALKKKIAEEKQAELNWDDLGDPEPYIPPVAETSTETRQNEPTRKVPMFEVSFKVDGTKSQISDLKSYIKNNGMTWKLVNWKEK